MTTTLVTGPSMLLLRDIAVPKIVRRLDGKLHTFKRSTGIPGMCSEIECGGDRFIFLSNDHGIEKFQGLVFDKWIKFGPLDDDLNAYILTRLNDNNIESIEY